MVKDTEPIKDDGLEPLQEASDSDASAAPYEAPNFDYEDDLTDFRDEFGYDPATGDMNDSAYEPYHAEDYGPDSEDGLTADSPVIEMGEDVVREDLKKNKGEKFRKAYKKGKYYTRKKEKECEIILADIRAPKYDQKQLKKKKRNQMDITMRKY